MKMHSLSACIILLLVAHSVGLAADEPVDAVVTIDAADPGIRISDTMWGLFFEEINFAGDGGIYAELVRQRDFEGREPLQSWSLQHNDATGEMNVDSEVRLNEVRQQSLRVRVNDVQDGGSLQIVNAGYWGIPIRQGEEYSCSMLVKADESFKGKRLQVSLRNSQLDVVYASTDIGAANDQWKKLTCKLTPKGDDHDGRLVITASDAGEFWLDMVSLFPPTYRDQPNGLRPDLVQLLADLQPSFFRFPGGCFAEGQTLQDAFRFKETVGPVEQRKGRRCFWGYRSTDGLGYFEYLRLAEDLGADPIFCINPGGNNRGTQRIPVDELGPWLDTAVHAVEFAIGPASSEWGAQRAAMGHPEPFRCKTFYLQIGNETEFGRRDYLQRFAKYRDHVKAAYPDTNVQIIADSWGVGHRQSVEAYAIDFHQYMNWGRAIADRDQYDDAPRGEPYVFEGEYATRSGSGILQGLSEAVYMMGLEENGDEVILAAYAPLFGNVNDCQWHPNLIYFDNHRSMGTISYYVQQMFSQNRGDRLLPVAVQQQPAQRPNKNKQMSGSIGLATWSTEAEFDDLSVVVDGETVYENDFSDAENVADWMSNGRGDWNVVEGVLRQSGRQEDSRFWLKDQNWSQYTVKLKARKLGGAEGFLIMFHVKDARHWAWANYAGWGNTQHAFERAEGGAKMIGACRPGSVESDRWYEIELEVDGVNVVAKLDGKTLLQDDLSAVDEEPTYDLYASSVTDETAGEVVVRLVNIAENSKRITLSLDGSELTGQGTAITLSAENREASQSLDDPLRYTPKTTQLKGVSHKFTYEVPSCSFTILRLKQRRD